MYSEPRLYLGKREITDFSNISYKNTGKNKVSTLSVTLTDPQMGDSGLLGQEVIFYLNYGSNDSVPFFRGSVKQFSPSDKNVKITAHDVLSYLTGSESPPIILNDNSNYDGFTLGQMLHDVITKTINKNETKIGLDMLNDTNPPLTLTGVRERKGVTPLKIVQKNIPKKTTSLTDIKNSMLVVRDDGTKSNICFMEEQDIDSAGIRFSFNDGIEKINYKRRQSPNYYTTEVGKGNIMEYQHDSLPTGIHSGKLSGVML